MNSGLGGVGGDTCYDSLEDLRRGQGLRRLPPLPNSKTTTSLQSSLVAEDWSKDSLLSPSSSFGLHDATISPTAANNNNDSLEDLSSLVEDPPPASAKNCITQRRSLVRSQTFAASPVEGMRAAPHQRRRQLPDIPAVGLSFLSADDPGLQLLLLRILVPPPEAVAMLPVSGVSGSRLGVGCSWNRLDVSSSWSWLDLDGCWSR